MTARGTPPLRLCGTLAIVGLGLFAANPTPAVASDQPAATAEPPIPPPLAVPRRSGEITLDGALRDPGWQGAAVIDQFFETFPGDNTEPIARTVAHLTYDDHYVYIGIHAFDPHPEAIRAPFVERDAIVGTDDNVAVFLDTRNDRRSALELRVNPRGDQADAVYDDGTGNEDFSPDVFYDTAARITADGWTAEYRIPFSSLRYPKQPEVHWGILIWRNYPRDQRYAFHSSPIPRGSNCGICRSRELVGLTGLPSGGHYVAAPYVTGKRVDEPGGDLGTTLSRSSESSAAARSPCWWPRTAAAAA